MNYFVRNVIAATIALVVSQATAAAEPFSKKSGPTPDGSGAQVVAAGMVLDERAAASLEREALDTFERLHPEQNSTVVWIGTNSLGRIEVTALPYDAMGHGNSTQAGTGPQPPTPPPPPGAPGTPDYVSRVDYHIVNYNGWNRDTSYSRTVAPNPNGAGFVNGPWGDPIDDHVYPAPGGGGGGNTGCGGTGQRPCPKEQ